MARSFSHPAPADFTMDAVLYALSDPLRRDIVMRLIGGQVENCSAGCKELSPSTVSFHHKILREAGLIYSEKKGVEVINSLREKEMNKRFPGLLHAVLQHHPVAHRRKLKKKTS